jgi:hypothetical protein
MDKIEPSTAGKTIRLQRCQGQMISREFKAFNSGIDIK